MCISRNKKRIVSGRKKNPNLMGNSAVRVKDEVSLFQKLRKFQIKNVVIHCISSKETDKFKAATG